MQSKRHSFIEALFNIIVGYSVALISQLIIFPYYNIPVTLEVNIKIGFWFSLISLVRSFVLRRAFNWYTMKGVR